LVTVGLGVSLTKFLLATLAGWGWITVFSGLETYVTVVVYGAGVDYCLFLIARYKEELGNGASFDEAITHSVARVGAALATSAGTSICGIGMMMFAEFGKFQQAGLAISLGLTIVLFTALTMTPALLHLAKRAVFWPDIRHEQIDVSSDWMPTLSLTAILSEQRWLQRGWEKIGSSLAEHPLRYFLITFFAALPFAVVGVFAQDQLSYTLLSDLPQDSPSVVGAKAVQRSFPAGITGLITVVVQYPNNIPGTPDYNPDLSTFDASEVDALLVSQSISRYVSDKLMEAKNELGIEYIRCQAYPLGSSPQGLEFFRNRRRSILSAKVTQNRLEKVYVSTHDGLLLRFDVISHDDPFSRNSISQLDDIESQIRKHLPADPLEFSSLDNEWFDDQGDWEEAEWTEEDEAPLSASSDDPTPVTPDQKNSTAPVELANATIKSQGETDTISDRWGLVTLGPTASLRDLKYSTDRDRILIDVLVLISVYLIIVALLREPAICAYLIVSVAFSYLVTMGVTYLLFWCIGHEFAGLDWKVPIYLFTILIAMGEDYNILLMARVREEQPTHGAVGGVLSALSKTGGIISSCGIIMAGTFASLMSSSLMGMVELGFALSFGVLLDTFIVRPILVPAYLVLLYRGSFGRFGRLLGAESLPEGTPSTPPAVELSDSQ